jgi:CNP1-like family
MQLRDLHVVNMWRNTLLRLLFASCALITWHCQAQIFPWSPRNDGEEKSWAETDIKRPPFPEPANLVAYNPGISTANLYYIDAQSISIGSDEVVRFTVVVKSPGGAQNVSYEGMRCMTREHRYYAFGRSDRSWSDARASEWRRIDREESNRPRLALYTDYFCPNERTPVKSVKDAVNLLRKGGPAPYVSAD